MGEEEEDEVERAYRVRCAVIEMLEMRDYRVSRALTEMTLDEFRLQCVNLESGELDYKKMMLVAVDSAKTGKQALAVIWTHSSKRLNSFNMIRHCEEVFKSPRISRAIMITRESITKDDARYCVKKELTKAYALEFFTEDELLRGANILTASSITAITHAICTEPTADVLEMFNLQAEEMPSIRVNRPLARYYGLRKGELLMTTEYMRTATCVVTYRLGV